MSEIDFEKIKIELLSEKTDVSRFDCEINDLNEFLKEDAIKQKNLLLNVTYVAYCENKLIAFFTLSFDTLARKKISKKYKDRFKDKDINYNSYPALKLGRLGVDKDYSQKGLGRFLLQKVLQLGMELSELAGLRFVTIDAYISAFGFYEKNNCEHSLKVGKIENMLKEYKNLKKQNNKKADSMTLPMFYDLYGLNQKVRGIV